jgi:hypothetical protein
MSKTAHRIFLSILTVIVLLTATALVYKGTSYYKTSLEERVYHADHSLLKPSGVIGHGLGILGSLFMIIGMLSYMARKRYRILSRMGLLKHWLEFHIFLCTLGPLLVLFHTAYKFGGLVAISFWSMVAVFLSGIIGRFIYIQIPRSVEGRELSVNEVTGLKTDVAEYVKSITPVDDESYSILADATKRKVELYIKNPVSRYFKRRSSDREAIHSVKKVLKKVRLSDSDNRKVLAIVKEDIKINRRIERLDTMRNLFRYWHVAHLPFAMVMLIIMVIHVGVTIVFGYRWIF